MAVRPQRYISTRAMFTDVRELAPASPGGGAADAAGAQAALRNLGSVFKGLLAACREDALVMEQARACRPDWICRLPSLGVSLQEPDAAGARLRWSCGRRASVRCSHGDDLCATGLPHCKRLGPLA